MGDTIEDMVLDTQQKDIEIELLVSKIGLPDSKVIEEMNKLGINKMSSKSKGDRMMARLNKSLNNNKFIENRKQ